MEELKIIMEGLSKLSTGAEAAFTWWCIKEAFIYLMCPATFGIVGITIYKTVINCIKLNKSN